MHLSWPTDLKRCLHHGFSHANDAHVALQGCKACLLTASGFSQDPAGDLTLR